MEGISIELLDHMGDDFRVWEAAKATLGTEISEEIRNSTDPTRLIKFLAKERHVTPFRHPQITLVCRAPIAIARQLGKHQVGFSWNERSMRYRDSVIDMFIPDVYRGRPKNLHEGSSDVDVGECTAHYTIVEGFDFRDATIKEVYEEAISFSSTMYEILIQAGLAPEQARFVLPQGMVTQWTWTGSLWGFFEVYRQRSSEHAQVEVQVFAEELDKIMSNLYPISWSALKGTDNV